MKKEVELTILMPCLNEEETIEICINKALRFLKKNKINGEILIADNGSVDNSIKIAKKLGVRVINVKQKGYGSALIEGSKNAYGKYVIMGDSDDSYDFLHLEEFVKNLRKGYDLVMGDRFKGGIEKGAMSFSHRYIGNPFLSFLGRLFYHSKIHDFHCGLRGYNKEKILGLNLKCKGMEYASEMIVKSELNNLKIVEVPTTLKKDGRSRPPHLRTIRDGFRHLFFLLINAPNWLFLLPGILLFVIGLVGMILLSNGSFQINNNLNLGIHSLLYFSSFIIIGIELCFFSIFSKIYLCKELSIKPSKLISKIMNISIIKLILIGFLIFTIGLVLTIISIISWGNIGFGDLNPNTFMPRIILANCMLIIGIEIIFSSFLINTISIEHR